MAGRNIDDAVLEMVGDMALLSRKRGLGKDSEVSTLGRSLKPWIFVGVLGSWKEDLSPKKGRR